MRLDVTDAQLLDAWKAFFDQNGNWKDLDKNMSYEKYKSISDKAHLKKITYHAGSFSAGVRKRVLFVQRDRFCDIAEKRIGEIHRKSDVCGAGEGYC